MQPNSEFPSTPKKKLNIRLFKRDLRFSHAKLLIFVLIFAAIGVWLLLSSFAAGPLVTTLEAERMQITGIGSVISYPSASGGQVSELNADQTTLSGSITVPGNITSIGVVARAVKCKNVSPSMAVYIDDTQVGSNVTVTSKVLSQFTFSKTMAAGSTHNVKVKFITNSTECTNLSRYLDVDIINFYGDIAPPPSQPTVSFSASPTTVIVGDSSTLTWNSTDSTSCDASGGWSGSKPLSGNTSTGALNTTVTYTLTCTGAGGSATASATVTVTQKAGLSFWNEGKPGTMWRQWGHTTTDAEIADQAAKHRVITLNAYDYAAIPKIRVANPNAIILAYKDLSSTRDFECISGTDKVNLATGVGYCDANTNHPDWFLKDSAGNRLTYGSYSGHWQMDIGIAAYQDKWLSNVIANLKALGFDGAWMDNALVHADTYHKGVLPAKYQSDAALQAAYQSMLDKVGTGFKNAGLISLANEADARLFSDVWSNYARNQSGAYDEYWIEFGIGNLNSGNGWKVQVDEIAQMEAAGKMALVRAQTQTTDTVGAEYTLASYLLANGGHSVYDEGSFDNYNMSWRSRPWYGWDLGKASGSYSLVSGSTYTYRRNFSAGTVIVNASPTAAQTVQLGSTYINESGVSVTSVSLNPKTAAILRK